MSYFTTIRHSEHHSFYYNAARHTSVSQFSDDAHVSIKDASGKNTLVFRFIGQLPIGHLAFLAEQCLAVALNANGNIRKLMEDTRVLRMYKEDSICEIMLVKRDREFGEITAMDTLWTPEDMEAMFSDA